MKNSFLLIAFILFMTSSVCFSAPGFDPNNNKPIIYDTSYNIALRKKLEDDYTKKYVKQIDKYHSVDTSPMEAYYWEVQVPYDLNKKRCQDTIIQNK